MQERSKPYFWCTWLTPLLAGENSCYWAAWFKGHYEKYDKQPRDGSSLAEWEQKHTALLNSLIDEYTPLARQVLIEGQTKWTMKGSVANVGGKMDLITIHPNLVIDAKSGEPKSSHIIQVQLYLTAIELGAVPAVREVPGKFTGMLRYPNGHSVEVSAPTDAFKFRFYQLVKSLAADKPKTVPSKYECLFCDIKDCDSRYSETEDGVFVEAF